MLIFSWVPYEQIRKNQEEEPYIYSYILYEHIIMFYFEILDFRLMLLFRINFDHKSAMFNLFIQEEIELFPSFEVKG